MANRRPEELDDPDWLRRAYIDDRGTVVGIAQQLGCDPGAVTAALRRHGIPVRRRGRRLNPLLEDRDWLVAQYVTAGRTTRAIADELGFSTPDPVLAALRRHGIPVRQATKGISQIGDRDWLVAQYVTAGRSMKDIGDELGCSAVNVWKALRRHGIPTRPRPGARPAAR